MIGTANPLEDYSDLGRLLRSAGEPGSSIRRLPDSCDTFPKRAIQVEVRDSNVTW